MLALGTVLTLVALHAESLVGFLLAAVVAGSGFGTSFLGIMRSITPTVGPDQRGELFSSVFVVSYLAFGLPAVAAGFAAPGSAWRPPRRSTVSSSSCSRARLRCCGPSPRASDPPAYARGMGRKDRGGSVGTPATVALTRAGISYAVRAYEHDPAAESFGLEAAEALGVEPARVLKTLLVDTGDGARRGRGAGRPAARPQGDGAALGAKRVVMADPAAAERSSGYVVGGISPIGQKRALPTVVDASAVEHATVLVSGGRRGLDLELAPADLVARHRSGAGADRPLGRQPEVVGHLADGVVGGEVGAEQGDAARAAPLDDGLVAGPVGVGEQPGAGAAEGDDEAGDLEVVEDVREDLLHLVGAGDAHLLDEHGGRADVVVVEQEQGEAPALAGRERDDEVDEVGPQRRVVEGQVAGVRWQVVEGHGPIVPLNRGVAASFSTGARRVRYSQGVERTTVVLVDTLAAARMRASSSSSSSGVATRTLRM